MKNFNEFITEAIKYKDRSGKGFSIKGIDFVYTEQGGKFYGTSLYDVAKTANVSKKSKISLDFLLTFADRKSTRLNSSHPQLSRMPSSA